MFAGVVAAIVVLSSVLHEPAARRGGRASEAAVATLPYVATVQSPDGATIVRGARDDPGSHIDLLADGTQVRVTPSVDTWQQVQLADGRTGYVQGARLRRLAEPTP